jgi:hypothetical protein
MLLYPEKCPQAAMQNHHLSGIRNGGNNNLSNMYSAVVYNLTLIAAEKGRPLKTGADAGHILLAVATPPSLSEHHNNLMQAHAPLALQIRFYLDTESAVKINLHQELPAGCIALAQLVAVRVISPKIAIVRSLPVWTPDISTMIREHA